MCEIDGDAWRTQRLTAITTAPLRRLLLPLTAALIRAAVAYIRTLTLTGAAARLQVEAYVQHPHALININLDDR